MLIVEVDELIEILNDAVDSLQFVERNVTALYHNHAVLLSMLHILQKVTQLTQRIRELAYISEDLM